MSVRISSLEGLKINGENLPKPIRMNGVARVLLKVEFVYLNGEEEVTKRVNDKSATETKS